MDTTLATGVARRAHRESSKRLERIRQASMYRGTSRPAAFRHYAKAIEAAYAGLVLSKTILPYQQYKKSASASFVVLDPDDTRPDWWISIVMSSWKDPTPALYQLVLLTHHARARMQQKDVDPCQELSGTITGLLTSVSDAITSTGLDTSTVMRGLAQREWQLLTTTGRVPLGLNKEGDVIIPTWIADVWSSPIRQEYIRRARNSGQLYIQT